MPLYNATDFSGGDLPELALGRHPPTLSTTATITGETLGRHTPTLSTTTTITGEILGRHPLTLSTTATLTGKTPPTLLYIATATIETPLVRHPDSVNYSYTNI